MRKCEALNLGRSAITLPGNIKQTEHMQILGIKFSTSGVSPHTWRDIISCIKAQSEAVTASPLPLAERAFFIKNVLCSKLWFAARVALPPSPTVRVVNKLIFSWFWLNKSQYVAQQFLRLPKASGGWSLPCIVTFGRLLCTKSTCDLLDDDEYPGRPLLLYWLGHYRRTLMPLSSGNLLPTAVTPAPQYAAAARLQSQLVQVRNTKWRTTPVSRLCEMLCETAVPPGTATTKTWTAVSSPDLPSKVKDFHWQYQWGILPTRDRLERWDMVANDKCIYCAQTETNTHVVKECVVARTFWKLVGRLFGISIVRAPRRRDRFASLVYYSVSYVLWCFRNIAERSRQPNRAMYPRVRKLRVIIWGHLEEQLFKLGEAEFLRRWSTRYLTVSRGKVLLQPE